MSANIMAKRDEGTERSKTMATRWLSLFVYRIVLSPIEKVLRETRNLLPVAMLEGRGYIVDIAVVWYCHSRDLIKSIPSLAILYILEKNVGSKRRRLERERERESVLKTATDMTFYYRSPIGFA